MYIILLMMALIASRGLISVETTNAITIPITTLIQRLNDTKGISDHEILTNIKAINKNSHILFLMQSAQLNCLFIKISRPLSKITLKNILSYALPSSMVLSPPPPNHTFTGLLKTKSIQMEGIHKEYEALGYCFISSRSSKRINIVVRIRINCGDI